MRCLNCHTDGVAVNAVTCPGCGVHLPSAHRDLLPPGTELHGGKYVIEFALGQGGFGITYRSIQVALNRRVAVKEFFPRDQVGRNTAHGHTLIVGVTQQDRFQRSLQRFQQEALTLAALHHPNVVQVLDIFDERGTAYIVMEYLSGRTLRDEMDAAPGRRMPEERVRQIVGTLVDALKAVHTKGVFHLDIKPDNVMVEPDGRIVLIDFGASRQGLTGRTTQAFSPEYAPLEARAGDGNSRVGPGSDIFELGMMLHEMLTGALPPDAVQRAVDMTRGGEWVPTAVSEPWKSLLSAALKIELNDRPSDISAWWNTPVKSSSAVVFTDPPVPGEDVRSNVMVTDGVVLVGGHVPVTPPHRDKMAVYVPPGVRDGQELRISGQGKPGLNGGKAGDLIITVTVSSANAKTAAPVAPIGRASLQSVAGDRPTGSGYTLGDPPPSAGSRRPVAAAPGDYQVPIWKPVFITLFVIIGLVGGAAYMYAPNWVPKYAPGLAPYLLKKPLPGAKPTSKPSNRPSSSGRQKTGGRKTATTGATAEYRDSASSDSGRPVFTGSDMEAIWSGSLGQKNAELRVESSSGNSFSGEVTLGGLATVRIVGSISRSGSVTLKETGVVTGDTPPSEPDPTPSDEPTPGEDGATPDDSGGEPKATGGSVWHLGHASGQLKGDGKTFMGRGANDKGGYKFSFSKS